MTDTPTAMRLICGHDSRSVDWCLHFEAADEIELLREESALWEERALHLGWDYKE